MEAPHTRRPHRFVPCWGRPEFYRRYVGGLFHYTGYRLQIPTTTFRRVLFFASSKRLLVFIAPGHYSRRHLFWEPTPTEAAAVSVVYALVVELFIHGDLKPKQLLAVGEKSMTMMGAFC